MAIVTTDVGPSEARSALGIEEGHFAEVKAIEVTPAKLTRALSAFANADGGEIYIGIDEERRGGARVRTWRGFPNVEAANGHLQAFEKTFPLDGFVEYQFLRNLEEPVTGLVLKAAIVKTPDVRYASDGVAYTRRGAQNLPAKELEDLRRLEYAKGVRSFETHPVDAPLEMVTNSEIIIEFMLDVVPTGEPEPWLRKQLLIRDGKPTVAAILVFADVPQAALPKQSTIKISRFATTEAIGTRSTLQKQPLTIEGNVYSAIHEAVRVTVELVESIRVMGPNGLEAVKYPEVALHEIITNAVLHRDYSIADDIHVRIFDNRIEVASPGRLPAHITPDNILEERYARNGNIVRWINKFPNPPNKDVGEGLRTAFDAMRNLKLKAPEITENANGVLVTIRHETLASPEEMIVEYLNNHEEISNSVVRALSGIGSENKVKRILLKMVKKGELDPIQGRSLRDAAYRLPNAAVENEPDGTDSLF